MVRVIKFNYNSFREKCRFEESERARNEYNIYSLVEAHTNAVEELLDYFELWLIKNSRSRVKVRVSKFNYVEFLYACKKEFSIKASDYIDATHQNAYIKGVHRALTTLKLDLIRACETSKREVEDKDALNLCIIWK